MIKEGYKFGCLAINTRVNYEVRKPLKVNDHLWIFFSPYKWMLRGWRKYLGQFRIKDFEDTNCIILATKPAQHIDMLDHDNKALKETVSRIYYALLLNGVARHRNRGFIFTGSNKKGKIDVRSYTLLLAHHKASKTLEKPLDYKVMQEAVRIAKILKGIDIKKDKYRRVKRGCRIFFNSMLNQIAIERLHQFVRAIEAIVKPARWRTKKQFVHRCQFFAGRSEVKRGTCGVKSRLWTRLQMKQMA